MEQRCNTKGSPSPPWQLFRIRRFQLALLDLHEGVGAEKGSSFSGKLQNPTDFLKFITPKK